MYWQSFDKLEAKTGKIGIRIDNGPIHNLHFANDQVILAGYEEDADYMFRKLVEECRVRGLKVAKDKTKYMVLGAKEITW